MSSDSQVAESWISAFCSLVGHEYFAEISEDFIEDDFNLTGLQSQVPMYKEALEMILDIEPEEDVSDDEEEEDDDDEDMSDASGFDVYERRQERKALRMANEATVVESSAELLYGLIHQRFITSRQGIQQMMEKYDMTHFGHCPRVHCRNAKVLPVGCSDIPGQETVKLFCPACLDVYAPPNSRFQSVDGAFFGTTFGCLFFMTFPELDVGGAKLPDTSSSASTNGLARSQLSSSSLTNASTLESNKGRTSLNSQTAAPPAASLPPQPQLPPQPAMINGVAPANLAPGLGAGNIYEPRIYGFRVSELAKSGPRMKWLRQRPLDVNELDEVGIWESDLAEHLRGPWEGKGTESEGDAEGVAAVAEGDAEEDMEVQDEEEEEGEEKEEEQEEAEEEEEADEGHGVQMDVQRRDGQGRRKGRRKDGGSLINGGRASTGSGGAAVGAG